ncbi:tubulin polyglutamylase ttll6-like isoform X2 [Lycorma delicatula]|uniref:tubulin polyglutamylase ttll6-like isoform X2 n=1 Tax=Lycorma delicatula TaxID=130591 RepID=UPI003F517B75
MFAKLTKIQHYSLLISFKFHLFFTDELNKHETFCKNSEKKKTLDKCKLLTPALAEVACMSELSNEKKKNKKNKKISTICLNNCKYGVIRKVSKEFGMREVGEGEQWNVYWTDLSVSVERAKEMKRFQKVNHFPGMSEICRKDLLARNLNRMLKMFPKDYNFFPKTWCLPADQGEVFGYAKAHPTKTFIIKPDVGCQGRGIFLTKSLKELRDVKLYERMICQVYISRPYLVDGFKFDMRVYTLITSIDPLRIFVYNEGLARFATSRYKEPAGHNTTNLYMHLTNYAVNKHSRTFIVDDEAGSKRRLSTVNQYFSKMDEDVDKLWASIDDIIIKTIISAYPVLRHSYHACFPAHDFMYACFELLGFDILLDSKLKPYILEVNHSPSFHTDTQLDKEIKKNLLVDTFTILNLTECHKKRALDEDKQRVKHRLLQTLNAQHKELHHSDENQISSVETGIADFSVQVEEWEMDHLGNFRLVYPNKNADSYKVFLDQNQSSIFQETFASRARDEARRIQREEFETKMKLELSRRIGGRDKEKDKNVLVSPESPQALFKRKLPKLKRRIEKILYSFEPTTIEEAEEIERLASMTQRDYLVRSYGVVEHIYQMMKLGGILRIADVIKYGVFEKSKSDYSSFVCYENDFKRRPSLMKIFPKIKEGVARNIDYGEGVQNFPVKCTILEPPWQKFDNYNPSVNHNIYGNGTFSGKIKFRSTRFFDHHHYSKDSEKSDYKQSCQKLLPGLTVTCNEAAMWVRPNLPKSSEWPSKLGAKSTRTFIARHFSNTLKLQDMETRLNADEELKLDAEHQSTL